MCRGSEGLIRVTFWTCTDATRGTLEGIPVMVRSIWESIGKKTSLTCVSDFSRLSASMFMCVDTINAALFLVLC